MKICSDNLSAKWKIIYTSTGIYDHVKLEVNSIVTAGVKNVVISKLRGLHDNREFMTFHVYT